MNEQERLEKNNRIRQSMIETKLKRSLQRCLVYELKINTSKINKNNLEKLKFLFVQCKWLYNYLLNEEIDIFKFDTKTRDIYIYDKDKNKISKTIDIPSKIIQSVHGGLKQNIQSLNHRKQKGYKIGKLKFKSEYNSIDLSQYNNTHAIKNGKFRICGFKNLFKVHGLNQIKSDYEIANAKLIYKPSGYYIKLTCFENLTNKRIQKPIKEVGLDFGIKTNITTSDNEKFDICIEESERLKGLQRKLSRQTKGSNNRYKTLKKIRLEHEKLSNKKKDKCNKLVNYLCINYSTIYMQDEMIAGWHKGLFGKQVQHSCLAQLKSKLICQPIVKVIDKSYPTTKLCYNCGRLDKDITLNDRTFICPSCGFQEERDLKAAKTILFIGQCKNTYVPVERRNTTVEKMSDFLSSYEQRKQSSMKQEAMKL